MSKPLQNSSYSEEHLTSVDLHHEKRLLHADRSARGIRWLSVGALLGFFSCICSICNPIESIYYINLYGVSSLAVGIAFYGLFLIFE